ncbi:DNA mismatch repair protein MutS [compost metagenome]
MHIDNITLKDLSVFTGSANVFDLINRSTTHLGTRQLRHFLTHPTRQYDVLIQQQEAVQYWMRHQEAWPEVISNGTMVMLREFFESNDGLHYKPSSWLFSLDAAIQKLFNKNAYSLLQFSVIHLIDLVKGLAAFNAIEDEHTPALVLQAQETFAHLLREPICREMLDMNEHTALRKLMHAGYNARRGLKKYMTTVFDQFAHMDAWFGMAKATLDLGFIMPEVSNEPEIKLQARQLFHPLLQQPVSYDIGLGQERYMLFLTGANMSGKSTLLRSLGLSALLAHIGMGVPAKEYSISFLDGIITNMQVEDNIFLGESYFFAEVQRMKLTAQKIQQSNRHLILMDELFKGTNVHDAYECSKAVIQHLLLHKSNLLALSTHLYELYEELKQEPGILFRYCETVIDANSNYHFTYALKEGVSNDKIGFIVLKHEGVLDMLKYKKDNAGSV